MAAIPGIISTAEGIRELAAELVRHEIVSFDTEFIRESTFFPQVELIQIATDKDSWLVDVPAFFGRGHGPGREGLRPLLDVFENKAILKVLHAAQGDQECLYTGFGIVATPTLDTAAAASLCGYGDSVGLASLLKSVLGISIKKGHARTDWSARPLPAQLLEYAHADVEYLVELARTLKEKLVQAGRWDWALTLSAKWEAKSLYESDPDGMAERMARGGRLDKRSYGALRELIRWREERVRQLNLPRRWVADDAVLLDLSRVRPTDLGHLGSFRGMNKGEIKHSGEAILSAIARGAEAQDVNLPPRRSQRSEAPSEDEAQVYEVLKCYVSILADRHRVAPRHLASAGQLLDLLRHEARDPEEWVRDGLISGESAQIVGKEILALLQGKRGLAVDTGRVKIVEL